MLTEIEFILDFYQGKMVTYDFNIGHTENEYSSDGSTCILHGCFHITTDQSTYTAYVTLKQADSNDSLNGGAAALSKCRSFFCIVNYD